MPVRVSSCSVFLFWRCTLSDSILSDRSDCPISSPCLPDVPCSGPKVSGHIQGLSQHLWTTLFIQLGIRVAHPREGCFQERRTTTSLAPVPRTGEETSAAKMNPCRSIQGASHQLSNADTWLRGCACTVVTLANSLPKAPMRPQRPVVSTLSSLVYAQSHCLCLLLFLILEVLLHGLCSH